MRLKKKVLAAIIIATLIITGFIAFVTNGTVQGGRFAYITIEVEKSVYLSGENVTFKLVPMQQIDFGLNGGDVRVVKIPSDVSPHELLNNISEFYQIGYWESLSNIAATIPFQAFNTTGEAISLTWNGTIGVYNKLTDYNLTYFKPTSGYYVLIPHFGYVYGHDVRFMLDENAIFYIDSINVTSNFVVNVNNNNGSESVIPSLNISYHGTSFSNMSCELHGMLSNQAGLGEIGYFNSSLILEKDRQLTVSYAEQYQPYYEFSWDGIVETPTGSFAFGWRCNQNWGSPGGLIYVYQY